MGWELTVANQRLLMGLCYFELYIRFIFQIHGQVTKSLPKPAFNEAFGDIVSSRRRDYEKLQFFFVSGCLFLASFISFIPVNSTSKFKAAVKWRVEWKWQAHNLSTDPGATNFYNK